MKYRTSQHVAMSSRLRTWINSFGKGSGELLQAKQHWWRRVPTSGRLRRQSREAISDHNHILPFQPILRNKYFPPEPAKTAKHSPKSISEGGRIWQVWPSQTLGLGRRRLRGAALRPIFKLRIYNSYIHIVYARIYSIFIECLHSLRPIFKLRIYNSGIWVKLILKRRGWIFLARRLLS